MKLTTDLRCSAQARALGADPAGSAVDADAFLLLEVPLPWPSDLGDHPWVRAARDAIAAVGARVQGVVAPRDGAQAHAVLYTRPGGPFVRYDRRHACLDADDLAAGIRSLAEAPIVDDGVRDVLVCAHGARDRCCGAMGTVLAMNAGSRDMVHVRRTSHLGGHRFAPTAVVLPEGTAWAWLDAALLDGILDRSADLDAVLARYRGSTALPAGAVQFVERSVFAEVGWSYLDAGRAGTVMAVEGERSVVRIETTIGAWVGVVERTGTMAQPVCGAPLSAAKKRDDILKLLELRAD